jgi:glycosyltransferase involved in cell wall biosynthesis
VLFHGYYRLNESPPVVSTWDDAALRHLAGLLKKEPVHCLVHLPWDHAVAHRMLRKKLLFAWLRYRGLRPLLVTNSPAEDAYRRRLGIPGFQGISYVYTDEKAYSVEPGVAKQYDAVYTAQLQPFKRLHLAAEVERLFVLTYTPGRPENDLPAFCPALRHAAYNRMWVDGAGKNRIYNASGVGLCLSAVEGPMLASLEYQLAGLPVVSTPSKGGRDTYYHPESSLVVPSDPGSVQAGVRQMAARNLDPLTIRQRTLARLTADRRQYVVDLAACVQQEGGTRLDPEVLYGRLFTNPAVNFVPLDQKR